MLLQERCKVT